MNELPKASLAGGLAGVGLLVLVLVLQLVAIHGHSLTGDGAHHLLAGHQALRYGQNQLNLEHPPLAKLVFALPAALAEEELVPPLTVQEALPWVHRVHRKDDVLRRATLSGRYMALAVFVVPFLVACFALGRRHGGVYSGDVHSGDVHSGDVHSGVRGGGVHSGVRGGGVHSGVATGILLTGLVGLSLGALPYLTILQTDTAVALTFLLTLLAAERYLESPGFARAAILAWVAALALVSKFSAVLLGPAVLVAVLWAPGLTWRRRFLHLSMMGVLVWLTVDATYLLANRSYSSTAGRATITAYCDGEGTVVADDRLAAWESRLLALERVDPYLAQWLTGFLAIQNQNAIGVYASYAFGEVRSIGRWWYFPVVFLVKTPLPILGVALWVLWRFLRRRSSSIPRSSLVSFSLPRSSLLLWITTVVYLAAALLSNYNLSVRHLLPVLPLLYLPVAQFLATRRRAAAVVLAALALEALALAPLWMSATNTWWLGEHNPTRFALGAGNLEYRQNFRQLARVAEERGLEELKVLYPTLSPEVLAAWVPGARLVQPGDALDSGWYAVNVTVEQLVPALLAAPPGAVYQGESLRREARRWEPLWRAVIEGEDHGYVAGTYHLYFLPPSTTRSESAAPPSNQEPGLLPPEP